MFRKFLSELLDILPKFYMISIDINWQTETNIGLDGKGGIREDVPTGRRWITFSIELYDKRKWKNPHGNK